ncbi:MULTISPECIES: adenine phosphoribosyltransferase [Carboxydocella]|uniref:Adenine phosphoribosyltransferase n=2 Tax=Carboxydocella TaxID=178898 RepID=A0A1T4PGC7_9FIRM|nr:MULTISPECIES: adenine phosphoribosyltransferase [Carboxydocella]AVX21459.1 adenine phosphoribosyltransferase [Carboxydocella thermautotrophica]AVX31947.1 adenine phosphoribosyltransferase [Carboxydocella thermautotrophica]SJZ90633.1 adenine phosphoribosyltransferase [Carboxydocella sporoproducens DSM 16521]GAW29205.1 adenine phosphoribosyltransferase [Carboxydocella sp. ULO1]GAW32592.1 adenine phosphoribosyltransferase [Carboxydocella sp. JDF658]
MNFKDKIRIIPDFPKPGIRFKDITTLLRDGQALRAAVQEIANRFRDEKIDLVVGPEARGFVIGTPVAYELGCGFVPLRKPGKLPAETAKMEYGLEYGKDALEIHLDAIQPGQRILLVDDLLATGGTTRAAVELVEKLGGQVVGLAFLIELTYLEGRKQLGDKEVFSLVQY